MRESYVLKVNLASVINALLFFYILSTYLFSFKTETTFISNIIALLLMGFIWFYLLINRKSIEFNGFLILYIIFILIALISIFYAINQYTALSKVKTLILLFCLMLSLTNYIDSLEKLRKILIYFVYSGFISSIYIIFVSDLKHIDRFGNELGNVNAIGTILSISAVICFYFIVTEKGKLFIFLFLIMFMVILLTGSRTALLFMIINIFLYLYLINRKKISDKIKFCILSVFIILISVYLIFNVPILYQVMGSRVEDMLSFIGGESITEKSLNVRAYMVEFGIEMFKNRPSGYGIDNYRYLLGESLISEVTYSHNNFIELLLGVGIFGVITFYLLQIMVIKKLFRYNAKTELGYVFIVLLISYMILSVSTIYYDSKHFSIIIAAGSIVGKIIKSEPRDL
ncbi:oligosaccharide repeat unit polymerase [Virgibacillus dakarensis]|nr:oligosaccharide repeat unit polymerase [Virgibacillus dakarensis]